MIDFLNSNQDATDDELGRCEHRACTNKATEVRNIPYEGRVVHICKEHADIYWGYDRDWR